MVKKIKEKIVTLPWKLKRRISNRVIAFFMDWLDVKCVQFYGTRGQWNTVTHLVKCECGKPFQVQSIFMPGITENNEEYHKYENRIILEEGSE